MKLIRKLFILSIIFSIGSIAGISVWADSNDIFTLSDSYVFYWFVAITSLLFSLALYSYHSIKMMIDYTKQNVKLSNLHMYVVTFLGGIYTIFWLGASSGVASNLRYCLVIRNNFRYNNVFNYFYNCSGQIISTFFGFLNFILWCVIVYYGSTCWYNIYKKESAKPSVTNDIELDQHHELASVPVISTVSEELPSVPVTSTIIEELPSIPITKSEEFQSVSISDEMLHVSVSEELPSIPISQEIFEEFPSLSEK